MVKETFSFDEFSLSSQLVRDLISEKENCKKYVADFFSFENVVDTVAKKEFSSDSREVLVKSLKKQCSDSHANSLKNIELLKDSKTFTVTTGHQLNLLTGPLYSIYKIAQTIALARELNGQNADYNFVPVFWMASEDHDFAEINHLHLFNQLIKWEVDSGERVVGRLPLDGIEAVMAEVESKYSDESAAARVAELTKHYKGSDNLADATRSLINHLFGEFGLVIIDGDDPSLKQLFAPFVRKELEERITEKSVTATNAELEADAYHQQVHLREINLFHIDDGGKRQRIEASANSFKIGDHIRTADELNAEVNTAPEAFSPNALMRPLYQEVVLPNLVYVGGGGEIAYWMQLKRSFEEFEVPFPLLRVRDSYISLNAKDYTVLDKFETAIASLKVQLDQVIKEWTAKQSGGDYSLQSELSQLEQLKEGLKAKASGFDASLEKTVEGEFAKWKKSIEQIEGKMLKAEKRKHETEIKRIQKLADKVFPNNGFQERHESFIPAFVSDSDYIKSIIELPIGKTPEIKILIK